MSGLRMLFISTMLLVAAPAASAVEYQWRDIEGNSHSLADFRGRPVLLHFRASWCPPCRSEMPELQAWSRQHPEVQLVPVSLDRSVADAHAYLQAEGITFPVLHGETMQDSRIGMHGPPTTLIIAPDGSIRRMEPGLRPWSNQRFSDSILNKPKP
ncbi:MAG: TlpA disulfide reductase family protein [Mariprofundaceae bacterium]|nr:TlpA disulfide reductase family protein [Mariprofundaceae bacterium]